MADPSTEIAAQLRQLESSYADNPGRYFVPYAGLLREAGEPARAEEVLRENLKRFPGLSAHVLLGRCLADRGARQEASNEFHYVLSIDSQNLIALRSLAEIAAAEGRPDEARRWYTDLLAVDPMNADARASVARLGQAGADAATADQPAGPVDAWPGGGGTDDAQPAGDFDEPEWGNLRLDDTGTDDDAAPAGGDDDAAFDALGFGEVALPDEDAAPAADDEARPDPATAAELPLLDFAPDAEREDADDAHPGEPGEPEVVTETMAELYAAQGLTARAAEVYRELIQRRGEEPALARRLAELEGRDGEPSGGDAFAELGLDAGLPDLGFETAEDDARQTDEAADDTPDDDFAASVSAGLGAEGERPAWEAPEVTETAMDAGFDLLVIDDSAPLDGDAHPPESAEEAAELSADWAVAAAPLEEQEEALEAEAGVEPVRRTMHAYFAALLAWSPGGEGAAAEPEPEAESEPWPAADTPDPEPESDPDPWTSGGAEPGDPHPDPWATPEPAAPEAAEADAPAGAEAEDPLPWELPAEADPAPAAEPVEEEAPDAGSGGGFSFEDFFGSGAAAPEAEPAPAPEPEPAPPPQQEPEPEPPRGGTEAAAGAAGDEDEDLESFQAWLQSLKR